MQCSNNKFQTGNKKPVAASTKGFLLSEFKVVYTRGMCASINCILALFQLLIIWLFEVFTLLFN